MTLKLRPPTEEDIPLLVELERQSFSEPNWKAADFRKSNCTVAEIDGQVVGFLVVRETFAGATGVPAEREILNVAVAEPFRQLGVATSLLRNEIRSGAVYFLEVRDSNAAAQALYRKLGFIVISTRKQYYRNPPEAAIVMRLK